MNLGTKDELLASLASLEREAEQAAVRLSDAEERAAALADEMAQTEGRAKLARRAVDEFAARIVEQREALKAVEDFERACKAVEGAAHTRNDAARRVGAAATALLSAIDELATTRAAVESTRAELVQRYGSRQLAPQPAEPAEFAEAWETLRERLRGQIDANLDEELLEAAARSPFATAVGKLPPHLQDAGRRRWAEYHRGPRKRS